jgi:hypothetical protein
MKDRIPLLIGGAAISCVVLAACGGDDHRGTTTQPPPAGTPPPAMTLDLDTAAVVAIIKTETSETANPFQVDGAVVAVTPVDDETSAPLDVNAT